MRGRWKAAIQADVRAMEEALDSYYTEGEAGWFVLHPADPAGGDRLARLGNLASILMIDRSQMRNKIRAYRQRATESIDLPYDQAALRLGVRTSYQFHPVDGPMPQVVSGPGAGALGFQRTHADTPPGVRRSHEPGSFPLQVRSRRLSADSRRPRAAIPGGLASRSLQQHAARVHSQKEWLWPLRRRA